MILSESTFKDIQIISEGNDLNKNWFIEGVFMQADVVNKNRRIYPLSIMEREIGSYNNEYVLPRRAVGELSHPDTPTINLDKITHVVENIKQEGSNFIGRARVLNTPSGNIVKGLLEGGVQLGVSSRGMGSVKRNGQGINEVQDDFKLAAIDIVYQPSAPDAFVKGLMEGEILTEQFVDEEDVTFVKNLAEELSVKHNWEQQAQQVAALEKFLNRFVSKL